MIFHYYTIIIDLRLFCFSSGDIYLSLGTPLSFSFVTVLNYFLVNFYIPLLYYYFNLSSSIVSCLSSGDIYLSLGISLSCLFVAVSESFSYEFFWGFCDFINNFILIGLFEAVLNASVADCFA